MQPVIERLVERLYGRRLVRNVLRGELVEQMVLDALGAEWREAGDYQNWDIEHRTEAWRIQVKQGAAMQSWWKAGDRPSYPSFSIDAAVGYSDQQVAWVGPRERRCELYIFAWHPGFDGSTDHRIAEQWQYYVVSTPKLRADRKWLGLAALRALATPVPYSALASKVAELLITCQPSRA